MTRYVEDLTGARRLAVRARRHWHWGRTHGWRNLLEEKDLDPRVRVPREVRAALWRRRHGVSPGEAVPVLLVGVQRSGTNMMVHGLDAAPEFEVRNEGDRRAFANFRLRPEPVIRDLVQRSRHRYVLLKPLCDSHRVDQLLDTLGTPQPGRAVWAYRDVDGRVRSALAKFGDVNLRVLQDLVQGRAASRWQVQRLSPESIDLIRSLDPATLSPESGAALFWYVRNALFFELGLDRRTDVALASYGAFLADPPAEMTRLCTFLGLPYRDALVAHVARRPPALRRDLALHPVLRERCQQLLERLDAAHAARAPARD